MMPYCRNLTLKTYAMYYLYILLSDKTKFVSVLLICIYFSFLIKLFQSNLGMCSEQMSTIRSLFSILNFINKYYNNLLFMSIIDKIIIYGVPNPQRLKLTEVLSNNIKVTTLQVYSRQSQSVHSKNQIDFEMWAYPDGIKIYDNKLQILNDSQPQFSFFQQSDLLNQGSSQSKTPPEYIYSFVLTDYDLNRTYCTCLIWNERYFIKDDRFNATQDTDLAKSLTQSMDKSQKKILFEPKQKYSLAIPKCKIQTMINNPLILDTNTTPVFVPKAMIVTSKTPCIQLERSLLKYYYENIIKEQTGKTRKCIKIPRLFENQLNQLIKNNGYNKAQNIFDNQKSETIRKIQLKLLKKTFKESQKDKSTGYLNVQTTKLKQFFISSLFAIPENPNNSFIFSQSGIPIASKFKGDTVFQVPKFFDTFSTSQSFQKFPIELLPLPIPQFVQLWKCLLLEKQIIVFSNSQFKSLMLSQIMLYLIQPIKWENIYIPFLPFHLAHHIEAIGGYLIGMSRIHMDYMLEKFQMKNKVVVDLEHKTILEEGGKQVIELPQPIKAYVQKSLKKIVDQYQQSRKPTTRGLINYLIPTKQEPEVKQKIKTIQNFVKHWLEIQKLFFHTLVMLFNNFIPFIVKKDDGIIAIRTQEYLNILDDKQHRNFMKEISKTMVFIRLCEYHVQESARCAWVQKNLGELFVYSHDILSHKFVVTDTDFNKGLVDSQKMIADSESKISKQRAYAWTVQDLLLQHEKYYQYIEYLFNKNVKQITETIVSIGYYLGEEQKKYKILNSQDQFQSFQSLESIELPADFGKKLKNEDLTVREKNQKELQYKKIYQKIQSEEVAKSKKNKMYGDKDEEELYQQFSKLCIDLKVQRFLIKYLKFMELNHPQTIVKITNKNNKKQKKRSGVLNWLWDLVNPPDSNRGKQQMEIKSKLQRKMTMRNIKIQSALNLNRLFGLEEEQIGDDKKNIESEIKKKKSEKQKQKQSEFKVKQVKKSKQQLIKSFKQNKLRISQSMSENIQIERNLQ